MNSDPLAGRVDPQDRERQDLRDLIEAAITHVRALYGTDWFSVHPIAMSVIVTRTTASMVAASEPRNR